MVLLHRKGKECTTMDFILTYDGHLSQVQFENVAVCLQKPLIKRRAFVVWSTANMILC